MRFDERVLYSKVMLTLQSHFKSADYQLPVANNMDAWIELKKLLSEAEYRVAKYYSKVLEYGMYYLVINVMVRVILTVIHMCRICQIPYFRFRTGIFRRGPAYN